MTKFRQKYGKVWICLRLECVKESKFITISSNVKNSFVLNIALSSTWRVELPKSVLSSSRYPSWCPPAIVWSVLSVQSFVQLQRQDGRCPVRGGEPMDISDWTLMLTFRLLRALWIQDTKYRRLLHTAFYIKSSSQNNILDQY